MTVFMIQFETFPVLLILSNAGSSSSSCRIGIKQAPALVDLRRHSFIMVKFSRLAYKQLTKLRQVHAMFCVAISSGFESNHNCRHESTEFLTTRADQSKHDILVHYVLNNSLTMIFYRPREIIL